jgi:hypothetical protein
MALSGFRNGCGRFTCDGDIAGRDLKAETRDHRHFATQRRIIDASEACRGRLLQSRGTGELSCRACREASTLRRIPSQAKADAAEAGGNLDGAALPFRTIGGASRNGTSGFRLSQRAAQRVVDADPSTSC